MKYLNSLFILLIAGISIISCEKEIKADKNLDFNVTLPSASYKVGDPVTFELSGNADIISVYTGEVYHDYTHRDGRIIEAGDLTLSFQSNVRYGVQTDQLSIVASTDFDGNYTDFSSILSATWTDITNRFALGSSATFVQSGEVNISDLVDGDKPLYIAFKYIMRPNEGAGRTWRIQNFLLTTETSTLGLQTLADMTTAGFKIVDQGKDTDYQARTTITATTLMFQGPASIPTEQAYENWIVSSPFYAGELNMGPDYPIAIKSYADPRIAEYTYEYSKSGNYKVYFVASNTTIDQSFQVIREIEVEITP